MLLNLDAVHAAGIFARGADDHEVAIDGGRGIDEQLGALLGSRERQRIQDGAVGCVHEMNLSVALGLNQPGVAILIVDGHGAGQRRGDRHGRRHAAL